MSFKFTSEKFTELERVLDTKFSKRNNQYRAVLINKELGRKLTIEIYPDLKIGEKTGNLVSIFTPYTHSQLHFCGGFVASDVLEEVTFFADFKGHLSGIALSLTEPLLEHKSKE